MAKDPQPTLFKFKSSLTLFPFIAIPYTEASLDVISLNSKYEIASFRKVVLIADARHELAALAKRFLNLLACSLFAFPHTNDLRRSPFFYLCLNLGVALYWWL
ncbi:MAG: hypothetical protein AAF298_17530 [Cyanobacteria bacterium P01_A01_bin.40]